MKHDYVPSHTTAMAWHCLLLAGVDDRLTGLGRLFECTLSKFRAQHA